MGDIVRQVDGQDVGDPLLLGERLRRLAGQKVRLTVDRPGRQGELSRVDTVVTPRPPLSSPVLRPGASAVAESVGIAYEVDHVVSAVMPGGPADGAGMMAGDRISRAVVVRSSQDQTSTVASTTPSEVELNQQQKDWPFLHGMLQLLRAGEQVKLTYSRDGQIRTAVLAPVDADDRFNADRGLNFVQLSNVRRAASLSEAAMLGVRETKEGMLQVFVVLRNIKDSFRSLGGPGTIAVAATMEASEGLARLLIFLTLLSANLAIINFLPIPVLDGGHMMFLLYEGISGKPVNERLAFGLTLVGLSFILGLMVFVIGLDVYRFSGFAS